MDNNKHNKSGFSFADDLMVDITGALFPGLLSVVILFISVIVPLMIYDNSKIFVVSKDISGSLWWVLLIVLLIVSYVIGHVSFRANIIEPDKRDVKRRITEELRIGRKRYRKNPLYKEVVNELRDQINAYRITLSKLDPNRFPAKDADTKIFYEQLEKYCTEAFNGFEDTSDYPSAVLGVLFPEEVRRLQARGQDKICFENLNSDIRQAMNKYRKYICSTKCEVPDEATLKIIVCSCILNIQSELGCLTENNCTFPYIYYYKYLLKRNLSDYLDEVTWNADNSRSKNVVNNYKIEIQLFAPEGYALVRKNEAHIRMSSGTWHMAQPLKWITGLMSLVMFVAFIVLCNASSPCCFGCGYGFKTTHYGALISFLLPFFMLICLIYIQGRITHFIHYQRMREIFHTISIYDDYKKIIEDKKQPKTSQKNFTYNYNHYI